MPAPRKKYPAKFQALSDPDLPFEKKMQLTREFATKYTKDFNKALNQISPDPYRGTRKLANTLIQAYPERFKNATAEELVNMVSQIGQVESGGANIAQKVWDSKKKKFNEGPGRGYYQIETSSAPVYGKTYENYRSNYLSDYNAVPLPKINVPKSGDVRALSKDQQASLVLSKMSARAGKSGEINPDDSMNMWLNYHWAGPDYQRQERIKHWEDTFPQRTEEGKGGRLTKKGKKVRKYGPRPDYMNQNPSGMTTGPIQQRSIGNTPGGGYMSFDDGGELPANDPYIGMRKFYDQAYKALDKYKNEEGEVSPFNVARAWTKASIQNPGLLFRKRFNLRESQDNIGGMSSEDIESITGNPYQKESPEIRVSSDITRQQWPTDYVMPNEKDYKRYQKYLEKQSKESSDNTPSYFWPDVKRNVRGAARDVRRFFRSDVPNFIDKCLPGEDCFKFEHGGWVYPANTAYPQYGPGGVAEMSSPLNVPQGYFLNPGQSRVQPKVYYPQYTPGQNAAKGTTEAMVGMDDPILNMALLGYGAVTGPYKLNPAAYQHNIPEGVMWRGLAKEGAEDALQSKVFRAKQDVIPDYHPGTKFNMAKKFDRVYWTPRFETAEQYGKGYIGEVPKNAADFSQRYVKSDWSQSTSKQIPLEEGRLLKKHWLQGYKPVKKSKGGWTGYPDHTIDSSAMEQFEQVRDLTKYKKGGMLKRKDGSYSRRGLWDNIRANRGSGRKPTKEMLEQERKIRAKQAAGGTVYKGYVTDWSPGEAVPWHTSTIGEPEAYGKGGYTVKRSSARKGKTHVVIGPDGTKKYFGDSKLGQHPGNPKRKKAFYARHAKNLKGNPYFRAFARATWDDGGKLRLTDNMYENIGVMPYGFGGGVLNADGTIDSPYDTPAYNERYQMGAGGFFSKLGNVGNIVADAGKAVADTVLSSVGGITNIDALKDVVKDKSYKTAAFDKASNVASAIGDINSAAAMFIPGVNVIAGAVGGVGALADKAFGIDKRHYNPLEHQSKLEKITGKTKQVAGIASMFMGNPSGLLGGGLQLGAKTADVFGKIGKGASLANLGVNTAESLKAGKVDPMQLAQLGLGAYNIGQGGFFSGNPVQGNAGASDAGVAGGSPFNAHRMGGYVRMDDGGQTGLVPINVEGANFSQGSGPDAKKGELLVLNGKVVKNYVGRPPHPSEGQNPMGDDDAPEGLIVIPKNRTAEYLESGLIKRKQIERSLISQQQDREMKKSRKMGDGGYYSFGMGDQGMAYGGPIGNPETIRSLMEWGGPDAYAKGGWIKKATASIKRRGTEGVCTGSKFGSSSCPPGSRRYNLAKTFRKMAKARKHEYGGMTYSHGGFIDPVTGSHDVMYGDGGQLPESLLRTRMRASGASPEEINDYVAANYGMGGNISPYVSYGRAVANKFADGGKLPEGILKARMSASGKSDEEIKDYMDNYYAMGGMAKMPDMDVTYKKGGGIYIKPANRGKFTAWAKSHGMGVQEAAKHVMANKEKYSSTIVKRANFARNAARWKHKEGGPTDRSFIYEGMRNRAMAEDGLVTGLSPAAGTMDYSSNTANWSPYAYGYNPTENVAMTDLSNVPMTYPMSTKTSAPDLPQWMLPQNATLPAAPSYNYDWSLAKFKSANNPSSGLGTAYDTAKANVNAKTAPPDGWKGSPYRMERVSRPLNINKGAAIQDLASLAPTLFNLGRYAFEKPDLLDTKDYMTPDMAFRKTKFDTTPYDYATSRALYNANMGLSGRTALAAGMAQARSAGYSDWENREALRRQGIDQANLENARANKAMQMQIALTNMQSKAKRKEFLGTAAEQFAQEFGRNPRYYQALAGQQSAYREPFTGWKKTNG